MIDLTAFQQLILIDVGIHERQHGRSPYGLAICDDITEMYREVGELRSTETINHGRLYPNLDTLADEGYLDKTERDDRTNEYSLTEAGQQAVSELGMLIHIAKGKDGANPYAGAGHDRVVRTLERTPRTN